MVEVNDADLHISNRGVKIVTQCGKVETAVKHFQHMPWNMTMYPISPPPGAPGNHQTRILHWLDVPDGTRRVKMGGDIDLYMGGDLVERNFDCNQHGFMLAGCHCPNSTHQRRVTSEARLTPLWTVSVELEEQIKPRDTPTGRINSNRRLVGLLWRRTQRPPPDGPR